MRLGREFNITGNIVLSDPPSGCPKFKNQHEFKGKVVWLTSDTGPMSCGLMKRLEELDKMDVLGVVYENKGFAGGEGFGAYFLNYDFTHKHSGIKLNIVEIRKVSGLDALLKDDSKNASIVLTSGDNPVTDAQNAWTALSVIMGLFSVVVLICAIRKWRAFVKVNKFQKRSVPQITLGLHVAGATWRIFALIDPPYARGIYPYQVTTFFDITLYPIVLCATLLIGFYWEDAMRMAKVHSIPTLQKMTIPFRICVGILFGIAFLGVVLRSLNVAPNLVSSLNLIIALVFSTPITIFYAIAASKVLRALWKTRSLGKRQRALHKMTLFLVGSSICMVLFVFGVLALAMAKFSVRRYIGLRFLLLGTINLMSLFQILAFQDPGGIAGSTDRTPTTSHRQSHRSEMSITNYSNTPTGTGRETAHEEDDLELEEEGLPQPEVAAEQPQAKEQQESTQEEEEEEEDKRVKQQTSESSSVDVGSEATEEV
eukprot:CAMPEP_0168555576 /NCGR_PEP_ID=MMETSP0413-20121227/8413_1 /TAXON_ID=136452 /ORGANISM="Filamoeba nolandi, Strain NC-AS-23-1" /LENGTH=482 /DNA_ID=CAMNT_0008586445 /DNA_START=168 /DNA_END=1616 /DNA_ORIENTATION=-